MHSILVIDDDESVLGSLRRTLGADGYDVCVAHSAEEALGALAMRRPDVVPSDIRLGGMDGLELLGLLRTRVPDIDVPREPPPQAELVFDQTSGFDPTDAEPVPDFEFDQSPPDAWEE